MKSKDLYNKGLELVRKGKYDKALSEFDQAIKLDPTDADAFSDRGVTKFHLKNLEGALSDMNESLRKKQKNPYRYASRAYIRDSMGDTPGAIEDYRKALEMDPENAITQNNLGLLEEKLGYMEIAQKRFKVADALADEDQEYVSSEERDVLVRSLLDELNIDVEDSERKNSLIQQMSRVFTSRKDLKDYLNFLKGIFTFRKR